MENKQNYFDLVKRENRISYIFTYIFPPILFVLIFFVSITVESGAGGTDSIGVSMVISLIYVPVHMIIYLPSRAKNSDKKFAEGIFQKMGFEKMVIRDEIIKKNHKLYLEFFILVVALSVAFLLIMNLMLDAAMDKDAGKELTSEQQQSLNKIQNFFYSIPIVPGIMVYTYYFYNVPFRKYPDLHLVFSIGCFTIIRRFDDITEIEKIHYTIKGLKHYDGYLRQNLKISINNLEKFYTKLLLQLNISDLVGIILSKLTNYDKLEFLKYLNNLLNSSDPSTISASASRSVKSLSHFIASIIASLIAAIIVVIFQNFI